MLSNICVDSTVQDACNAQPKHLAYSQVSPLLLGARKVHLRIAELFQTTRFGVYRIVPKVDQDGFGI